MSIYKQKYDDILLSSVQKVLEKRYFAVTRRPTLAEAVDFILEELVTPEVKSVGFGGSASVGGSDLLARLKSVDGLNVIDRNDPSLSPSERSELSRKSLLVDLFIASANALTLDGEVVNLDKFGNRVAAITFGPLKVALIIGRNKIVRNLEAAKSRVKNQAAPMNAMRLEIPTPCAQTGHCQDCQGPSRICGVWSIVERSFPQGRIHIILVNEELGF
ncbi:MAG: lactate utilization protein [Deltaproteobacteria bacterium]|jgi:hypothetical protein|nr:lactate utilization protein [Deltaproteobacteria bacterium]